mmetsp:Transcript_102145/g.284432  ORF Transcript_102145/g.284432 Transcript_102145/m.284432 type:complete len:200 (-) Transcript_102145:801-1400(-)
MAVFQAHQEALTLWSAAHDLYVADQRIQVPFALEDTMEGVQLQLPLLAQDDVVRGDHQQGADELLFDLLDVLVVHVQRVVVRDLVDEHLVRQLHGQAVAIHRDLLHVVLASDTDLLLGDKVLDDDIGHDVAVGVAVLVQAMHRGEDNLVHHHGAVIATNHDVVLPGPHRHRPDPVLALSQVTQEDTFAAPELDLLAAAS